jgi:hypothetical protein
MMAEMVSGMRPMLWWFKTRRPDGVSGELQEELDKVIEGLEAAVEHFERTLRAWGLRAWGAPYS